MMTKLQERILGLLLEIDSICRKNDIEYYLAAGTALGAVRHKGFIPWDDDADIYMTADNWKKFYALRDELPKDRALVTVEENFDAEYTINRYVDLSTTRLYRFLCASPQPAGLTVDIIILDSVPDNEECIKDYVISLTEYSNILCVATSHTHRCPYPINYEYYLNKTKEIGKDAVLVELRDKMLKYEDEPGGVYIQRDATVPHVWKKDVFGKPQYVQFENTELPIPSKPYDHLCVAFDEDWPNIPSGTDQAIHVKGVNYNISNNNAYNDYLKLVDPDVVRDFYVKRQVISNLQGDDTKQQQWNKLFFNDIRIKTKYKKKTISSKELLKKIADQEFDFLDQYFADYYECQCDKNFVGNVSIAGWLRSNQPYYIDINDGFLYCFLRYLMHYDKLNKAVRVLRARKQFRSFEDNDEKLIEIEQLITDIKEMSQNMMDKQYEEVYRRSSILLSDYPENKYLLDLYYSSAYLGGIESAQTIQSKIENSDYIDDVMKAILADVLWNSGDRDAALSIDRKSVV